MLNEINKLPSVIVAGAHSIGALGVIRSLGRAGYTVHAISNSPEAIGLRLNFARFSVIHPNPEDSIFEKWAIDYIERNDIKLIIPGGAISLSGHPVYQTFSHLFPIKQDVGIPAKGGKFELFSSLLSSNNELQRHLPPLILVSFDKGLDSHSKCNTGMLQSCDGNTL